MTNTVIEQFVATYGNRMFGIGLDNNRYIYLGYGGGSPEATELRFTNVGGEDFIVVERNLAANNANAKSITIEEFIPTYTVQYIGVMSEEDVKFRPDMRMING